MRRLGFGLVVLTLAGCSALRDTFSAHPVVAASAARQDLTVERLAQLAAEAKKIPLRPDALSWLASLYVDYELFAVQLARGRSMDDSALVLQANWPEVSQLKWERFHERLVTARSQLTPAQVDSAYQAGQMRLFQHILLQVPPSAAPTVEQKKRTEIQNLLQQATAQHGATFADLARRYSEDPGSKKGGGYLQVAGRGQFVVAFDTVAWRLVPGAVSGVVRSPFGFHLIRRPPLAEVRDSFRAGLETHLTLHLDSVYLDSLAGDRQVKVAQGAPALVRQALQDMAGSRDRRDPLVRYRGGRFRVRDLVRWVFALDPNDARGLPAASDDQLRQFLLTLTKRDVLLSQIDASGIRLTPDDWRLIRTRHDSVLTILQSLLGISPEMLKDSAATEDARIRLASAHVDGYLDRLLQGQTQFLPVPPFLAQVLQGRESWSVNPAGVARAVERAEVLRTAARGAAPAPGGALRPAPGPAPVPGDTTRRQILR